MSAVAERTRRRAAAGERPALDRLLATRLRVSWDVAALALILAAGTVLRFWDPGSRAIHHDESLHATFSWYFYRGDGYVHDPLMHGPLLFHLMAFGYGLLGVSDSTARFVPALLGAALIALPWLLRGRLGRVGAVAAAALIAFSPTLLYFSRFVGAGAQDIVLAVTTLLIATGIWRYLADGRSRWLYLIAAALCASFATKEVTFIVAVVFIVWLNGLTAAEVAARRATGTRGRWGWTLALMPVAWLAAALWPLLGRRLDRTGDRRLPRAADLLLVLGLFTAPQFAAAVQVPLERLGVAMAGASPIDGMSNEALVGGLTVGLLVAATTAVGLAWRRRDFLVCLAIFWGIYVLLFTTFFTNFEGLATGIWGSLDYWLEQQGEERGKQPVFYYAMLTPVYEYLALLLAVAGIVRAAVRGGWLTAAAVAAGVAAALLGVIYGHGDIRGAPFAVAAIVALVLALRRDLFRSFLAFWAASLFFGLSVAGEKMPWLEVHIALPLVLLAALTVNEAVVGWRQRESGGVVRWRAVGGAAFVALVVAALLPLTVRDGVRASFQAADTPSEMLIYTQSSPHLKRIKDRIDVLAAESGMGNRLPIVVDSSSAYTWPWAWYLRDYRAVRFLDLDREGRGRLAGAPQPMVLLAASGNDGVTSNWPDAFGPGEPYAHRWWFPEEGYRRTTGPRFWAWLRDASVWRAWRDYFLDRELGAPIGTTDAVAFFPRDFRPADGGGAPAMMAPREVGDRLITGNPGLSVGAFDQPAGVALAPDGTLIVADSRNRRVQRFDAEGRWLASSGPEARLREPWAVAVDDRGFVYVADAGADAVVTLDQRLRPVARWGGPAADDAGAGPTGLRGPRGIAAGADGVVWVADTGHDRVVKLGRMGETLAVVDGSGTAAGRLQEPAGLALAPDGSLLVADGGAGRIVRFDAAMHEASEIAVDNWRAHEGVQSRPALALLPDGSIVATVPDDGRVRVLTPEGALRHVWDRLGNRSTGGWPLGVAVDGDGRVWVSDGVSHQLIRSSPP